MKVDYYGLVMHIWFAALSIKMDLAIWAFVLPAIYHAVIAMIHAVAASQSTATATKG